MPTSISTLSSPGTSTSALTSDASAPSPHDGGGAGIPQVDGSCISAVENVARRRSIKFNTARSEAKLKERSVAARKNSLRRIPSPPPPSSYNRGVSFDTFDNRDAQDFALTLNYKHKDYQSTRRSRTFLCGADQNDYSDFALEWLMDELVDDGDEIVCLRVVEKDSKIASDSSIEKGKYIQEAEKLFDQVIAKNSQDEKAISLVMELAVGKIQEIIQRMIQIYEPAVLIVGTRGRSLGGMQGLLPGSVSKYCLQQSPIPVIVVRPSTKREKKKKKRMADPSRRSYNQILRMSEAQKGGSVLDKPESANSSVSQLPDADEATAVAQAIGISPSYASFGHHDHGSRSKRSSYASDTNNGHNNDNDDADSTSTKSGLNPSSQSVDSSEVVLKSPALGNLASPNTSDESDADDDRGDSNDNDGEGYTDNSSRVTPLTTTGNTSTQTSIDDLEATSAGLSITDEKPDQREAEDLTPLAKPTNPVIIDVTPDSTTT